MTEAHAGKLLNGLHNFKVGDKIVVKHPFTKDLDSYNYSVFAHTYNKKGTITDLVNGYLNGHYFEVREENTNEEFKAVAWMCEKINNYTFTNEDLVIMNDLLFELKNITNSRKIYDNTIHILNRINHK